MTEAQNLKLQCPSCGKDIYWSDDYPHRPFCSQRCKLIDLGEWASESHRSPGAPLVMDELDEDGNPIH